MEERYGNPSTTRTVYVLESYPNGMLRVYNPEWRCAYTVRPLPVQYERVEDQRKEDTMATKKKTTKRVKKSTKTTK